MELKGINKVRRARLGWMGLLTLLVSGAISVNEGSAQAETSRYIVTFKNSSAFKLQSQAYRQSAKLRALGVRDSQNESSWSLLGSKVRVQAALDNLDMMIVESSDSQAIEQLRRNPEILDVEKEVFFPAPRPVDQRPVAAPSGGFQILRAANRGEIEVPWGIKAVKAEDAWSITRGENARVAILDTGIDEDHPDIKSRFQKGQNFTGSGASFADDVGHGTHVAGTIAADGDYSGLVGVAPRAKLWVGKVCGGQGCSSAAIANGINWAVNEKVDVISMSLGGPFALPSQQRAVERAEAMGVVVVAASGNDGKRQISYPAQFPTVVAVGALQQDGSSLKRAGFSNYGPALDVAAPGVDVLSSVPQGAGRVTTVMVDFGDGKLSRVPSAGVQGAAQNSRPISGVLAFAGLGKSTDFKGINIRGKIALIQRGEITFREKAESALNNGAIGVLIFNNDNGVARGGLGDANLSIPVAMIERSVGEQLKAALEQGKSPSGSVVTEQSDYDRYDGTSMATPHVAGVVALIRSANKSLTPSQVRDILAKTATNLGPQEEYGAGVVNAAAAVSAATVLPVQAPVAVGL